MTRKLAQTRWRPHGPETRAADYLAKALRPTGLQWLAVLPKRSPGHHPLDSSCGTSGHAAAGPADAAVATTAVWRARRFSCAAREAGKCACQWRVGYTRTVGRLGGETGNTAMSGCQTFMCCAGCGYELLTSASTVGTVQIFLLRTEPSDAQGLKLNLLCAV